MSSVSAANHRVREGDTEHRPVGLEIILLKRTFVFPWSQFLYAEGDNEEIRLVFSTHDIVLKGSHLDSLFTDLSSQRVSLLREPFRAERFATGDMHTITSISVRKVE